MAKDLSARCATRTVLVSAFVACMSLTAQVYVPDNVPNAGPINYAPLGAKGPSGPSQNLRTQIRVPASALPSGGSTIVDVGLAGASTGYYGYSQLEVRLAHLAASGFALDFAANLAGAVVVLQKSTARVDTLQDQWKAIGLTGSFPHDGVRDLVVDIVIQGATFTGTAAGTHRSGTLETVFATDYFLSAPPATGDGPYLAGAKLMLTLQSGALVVVGQGCPKANQTPVTIAASGTAALGTQLTVRATAATPSTSLLLLLGASETTYGSLTLPYDLAPLNAPGCLLRTDIVASPTVAADATGSASSAFTLPTDAALRGRPILFQWFAPAPGANGLQGVLSAMLRATLQ